MSDDEFQKVSKSVRPSVRPPVAKEETPRERAERRAAELRGHSDVDDGTDEFFVEPGIIPDGWSYEWKTRTVLGAEDPAHQVALQRKGWEVIPASRHPEMMPLGYKGVEIIRKGMVLMERPLSITEEARQAEARRARLQVRAKEEQLSAAKPGEFGRDNKGDSLAKIKKGYEAMPIPE
jgi:hypothetical protein